MSGGRPSGGRPRVPGRIASPYDRVVVTARRDDPGDAERERPSLGLSPLSRVQLDELLHESLDRAAA